MNTMTGDPNQENRPSVFGFEPYPSLNVQPIDWSRIPMTASPSLAATGEFTPSLSYQQSQGNFSFCGTQTPHPAQFPFPSVSPVSPASPIPSTSSIHSSISHLVQNNVFGSGSGQGSFSSSLRCKRKTESPTLQPCKQHITEEKMAEHMSRLHISSETATSSKETDCERTKRLYMCEEMRKLQSDSILPQSILSKIQRPCTALVLWTPPRRIIPLDQLESNNGNNNEESTPDHNKMTSEEVVESDMNNMDLDNV